MAKKDFIKITIEDIELAENYFENDKHLSEFLLNVIKYYRGKDIQIKTKKVQKYFTLYKKTMNYIIESKLSGKYGSEIKAENQLLAKDALEGVVEDSLPTKKKEEREKKKEEREKPSREEFVAFASLKKPGVNTYDVGLKYDAWMEAGWETGNGKKIKNWKSTLLNTLPFFKISITQQPVFKSQLTPEQNKW